LNKWRNEEIMLEVEGNQELLSEGAINGDNTIYRGVLLGSDG
jgi:hypothetical protein